MRIELIGIERLSEAYTIYNNCRKTLTANSILQWTEEYPTLDTVAQDIANKELFGLIDNETCKGLVVLNIQEALEYNTVKWQDMKGKFLVIHRLAVNPLCQKQGIGKQLMNFAEAFAKTNKYTSIRLDTYSGNPVSVALYLNRGYTERGQVYFKNRELHFLCLEKAIK
jgi:ribosomal protein S18 acetylase RimI-like enzyme